LRALISPEAHVGDATDVRPEQPVLLVAVVLLALVALVAVVAFACGYAVALARPRRAPAELAPTIASALTVAPAEPERLTFSPPAAEGTSEWRVEMADLGERMRGGGVRVVVFAHGSFVGDDPIAMARTVEDAVPVLPDIGRALRGFTRSQVSRYLGDLSNFSRAYVETFAGATGVDALEFTWSGENHHAARVQAAVRLSRTLALYGGGALRPADRVLLIGHSHAGQVFAALSQLVARAHGYEELVDAARARGEDVQALEDHLAILRRCAIDVVTFGTSPRYGWAPGAGFRLLHVVNHRGASPRAPSLRGLFHTRQGDYVQQLGAHGSDLPASTAREREINARLDRVLGVGSNLRVWLRNVAQGLRVSPHGHTVLVDYGDGAGKLPNFWATGFGHAAYTRRHAMLFHVRLVVNHFYPVRRSGAWGQRVQGWVLPLKRLPPRRRSPSRPDA
jgi:hypothetical protein